MDCVYVAVSQVIVNGHTYDSGSGPIPGIESEPGFQSALRHGLVEPRLRGSDGKLSPPAYAATRQCTLGGRPYSAGEIVPGAHGLPTFRSLVACHAIEIASADRVQPGGECAAAGADRVQPGVEYTAGWRREKHKRR